MAGASVDEGGRSSVAARLEVFGAEATPARMIVTELTPAARVRRGVGALGACWGAAVVAVFFPVIHLVLVPTLLVSGGVAAVILGRQARRVRSVSGTCPRCRTEQTFDASGTVQREQLVTCPRCHTNLTLRVEDGAAGAPNDEGNGR